MFILCFFFLNGILVFTSISGNRTLSGRVTSIETIRSCSFVSGALISCKFLSRLKFLSVGAMPQRFVQIPYRSISGEAVLQSPISARNFASSGALHGTSIPPAFVSHRKSIRSNRSETLLMPCPLWSVFPSSNTFCPYSTAVQVGKTASPFLITSRSFRNGAPTPVVIILQ